MKANPVDIRPFTRQFYVGAKQYFALVFVYIVFNTVANLMISTLLQQLIDLVSGIDIGFDYGQLILFALAAVLVNAVSYLCAWFSRPRFITGASERYRNYVFGRISEKGIAAFSGENTATYISALSNDALSIENGYLNGIINLFYHSLLAVSALALMFWYSPVLTIVSILLSILPMVISLLTGSRAGNYETMVSKENEQYMSTLRDSLAGFSVIKSFRAEVRMAHLFAQSVRKAAHAKEKRLKFSIVLEMLSTASFIIVQFGVFFLGAYLAISKKSVTGGTVIVFVQLLNYVLNPISIIPQAIAEIRASRALIRKLAASLNENVRLGGGKSATCHSAVTLTNVSYAYEEGKPVLNNLSFKFESGKSYAIVGASGSGKTTLLNLMTASSDSYTGDIQYDGVSVRDVSAEALYALVSVVQQNVFIFNASIRDNITMFTTFPKEEVDAAIHMSGLAQLIASRGKDYLCGENGSGLSGGEKQRISIARSLLKKSDVLLADEATASLDAQTAHQVTEAILNLDGLTRIIVTHALDETLLKKYDCILAMKNGRIEESGAYDELMKKKGYFYSLYTVSR